MKAIGDNINTDRRDAVNTTPTLTDSNIRGIEMATQQSLSNSFPKNNSYQEYLASKAQLEGDHGFSVSSLPDWLFPFQQHLIEWALRKGRAAIFADCGLGKTPMQLVWADKITRKTNGRVLVLTPLAVSSQTVREADKFHIDAVHCRDGKFGSAKIVVTNYERLHYFDAKDFIGCVCDESSILKNYSGSTRKHVTRFLSKMPYRSLLTATPSPNDYVELGTSSEALGEISHSDMLKRFFKYLDDKGQKQENRLQANAEQAIAFDNNYYQKLSFRVAQTIGQWRLKHHAVTPFWRWVSSWARACRMPSDLGFDDGDFILPELTESHHIITPESPPDGMLFNMPAIGLQGERDERRRTLIERCELAGQLVDHKNPAVIWCHYNNEGDLLADVIPDAEQIQGSTPDERKLELYEAFASGDLRVLVIKPKIGAWGLNWQHCNHVVSFASHSYEQYYQSVRRCWRFGQKNPVQVDTISTIGEERVFANLQAKAKRAEAMFIAMVREMNSAECVDRVNEFTSKIEVPEWV